MAVDPHNPTSTLQPNMNRSTRKRFNRSHDSNPASVSLFAAPATRFRDVTTQLSALAEQLTYTSSLAIALYLLTFFTVVGLAIFLYRRHQTSESSLVYAPLNAPLELLPVAERTGTGLGVSSRYGKKRMAAVLARKARRVWARGKRKISLGTRKWGRRNKKVLQWDLPQDDQLGYTDEESVSEFEDEYDATGTKSQQPEAPAVMVPVADQKSLIDLSHIIREDDIGEPNKHGLELVEFVPREQHLTAWPILTPTSSVSSNPSAHPSEDLVDLNADDIKLPFSRYKFPSVPTMPLFPSPPMTTPTASPVVTYKVPVLDQPYDLDMKSAYAEERILTRSEPGRLDMPVAKLPMPLLLSRSQQSVQQLTALPSPPKTDIHPSPGDNVVISTSPTASEILDALEEQLLTIPVSVLQEQRESDSIFTSEKQLSSSPPESSPSPRLTALHEVVPVARELDATVNTAEQSYSGLHLLDGIEKASIPSQQLHIDVPLITPARIVVHSDPEYCSEEDNVILDVDDTISLIGEDMVVDSLSPLPSPLLPRSPELRSALLTPDHTPLHKLTFSPSLVESPEIPVEEEEILAEEDNDAVSSPPTPSSVSSPLLPPNDISHDRHEKYDQRGEESDAYCSDPELHSLPSSPMNKLSIIPVLIEDPAAAIDPTIPEVCISGPACETEVPLAPSPITSSPARPQIAPIQTPTPPPSPPGPNSPLPVSPHPHLGVLQRKESEGGSPSSPQPRPAWSLRAADAPTLGLPSTPTRSARPSPNATPIPPPAIELSTSLPGSFIEDSDVDSIPADPIPVKASNNTIERGPLVNYQPPRLRNLRSPVDIALAMQLRPGLGLGADPAWMVRFLMAMFGWLAVLVGQAGDF